MYEITIYEDRVKNIKGLIVTIEGKEYLSNPGETLPQFLERVGLKFDEVHVLYEVSKIIHR